MKSSFSRQNSNPSSRKRGLVQKIKSGLTLSVEVAALKTRQDIQLEELLLKQGAVLN